jgi:tripartite-type tricarboxylate transporter receptor subunit TctC
VRAAKPAWLNDGTITILSQFGLKRLPELPNVPTAIESARNDEERQILTAIMSASEIGSAYFTTPGTPADRVTALRRAFDATMKDEGFIGDLKRMRMSSGPLPGEKVQKMVMEFTKMSPELLEKVRAAYTINK